MSLTHYNLFKIRPLSSGIVASAILSLFLFSGCYINFSNYGNYQRSQEVSRMFQNLNLPPDYTYYYAHTFSQPQALVGIEPGYTLDNHLWTRVNPDQLKRLTDNMWIRAGYSPLIFGSYITAPDGKTIGIYYSRWKGGPIVMKSGNKVNINLPNTQMNPLGTPAFG